MKGFLCHKKKWHSNIGYIWAMIGSAVGFGPILSFSARCYFNGGGAFLIPLAIAVIVLGLPLLILEGVIEQHFQLPLVAAYGKVAANGVASSLRQNSATLSLLEMQFTGDGLL